MEVFEWYLAKADGSYANATDPSTAMELPQFLVSVEGFVGPLYSLLLKSSKPASELRVFDKTVFADPRLNDPSLWDGTALEEIKRVNPELIRLLAGVAPNEMETLAAAWFSSAGVRDMVPGWEGKGAADEPGACRELSEILRNLVALAKQARKAKKDVMERFWWATR